MKKIQIFKALMIFIALMPFLSLAQNETDALLYSQTFAGQSTAKSLSMSGSGGALGGDYAFSLINPANLSFCQKFETSLSPLIVRQKNFSSFLGEKQSDEKYNFVLGNLSAVVPIIKNEDNGTGWSVVLGAGLSRIGDFNLRRSFEGVNNQNSFLNSLQENASGLKPPELDLFYSKLAFDAKMIDTLKGQPTKYKSAIPSAKELQRGSLSSRGGIQEISLSVGAKYGQNLSLGCGIGIQTIHRSETNVYQEVDAADSIPDFQSFEFRQNLEARGTGFNFKLGAIYQPLEFLRFGLSAQTGTVCSMHESYSSSMTANFDDGQSLQASSPDGSFDYKLNTPTQATMSAGFILPDLANFNIDWQVIDYADARLRSKSYEFFDANSRIYQNYRSVNNIRFGTEWYLQKLRIRGGCAFYGSPLHGTNAVYPLQTRPGQDMSRISGSLGLGIKEEIYYIDLGYSLGMTRNYYQPYSLKTGEVSAVSSKVLTHNLIFSIGFTF